jgi:hypothetical protein
VNDRITQTIDEVRDALETVWETMAVEDFRRLHGRFVGVVLSVEAGFRQRFPEEWAAYQQEFYGEDGEDT